MRSQRQPDIPKIPAWKQELKLLLKSIKADVLVATDSSALENPETRARRIQLERSIRKLVARQKKSFSRDRESCILHTKRKLKALLKKPKDRIFNPFESPIPYTTVQYQSPEDVAFARQYKYAVKVEAAKRMRQYPTLGESTLWAKLRSKQPPFHQQKILFGWIADFYCHEARLTVEVDGKYHEDRKHEDAIRDSVMLEHGIETLRFTNEQVLCELPSVLAVIDYELETDRIVARRWCLPKKSSRRSKPKLHGKHLVVVEDGMVLLPGHFQKIVETKPVVQPSSSGSPSLNRGRRKATNHGGQKTLTSH